MADKFRLQLIVLQSTTGPFEIRAFRDFVACGFQKDISPLPVIPCGTVVDKIIDEPIIVTMPQNLRRIVHVAAAHNVKFKDPRGIRQEKVLELFHSPNTVATSACLLPTDHMGQFLRWAVNWLIIDKDHLDRVLEARPDALNSYNSVVKEERIRADRSVVNVKTIREKKD